MTSLSAWLALAGVLRLPFRKIRTLLGEYSVEQLVQLPPSQLKVLGFSEKQIAALLRPDQRIYDRCLAWLEGKHCTVIPFGSQFYPHLLAQISSPPLLLFVQGDPSLLTRPQIAIVGSRQASDHGMQAAYDFGFQLAQQQVAVTSGLALGIDGRAHRAALDAQGKTIAVLGSGLDVIYPKAHQPLAHAIAEQGTLVSEFFPWTPPKAEFFPKRNRIISGLSTGVLVIEAAMKSGSLITARSALEQGRDVFALPNSIYLPSAQGSNGLIKQGAFLVDSVDDIISQIAILAGCAMEQQMAFSALEVPLSELPFADLLANVGNEARCVDRLAELSKQPVHEIMTQLLELELQGLVTAVPGGYVRTRRSLP